MTEFLRRVATARVTASMLKESADAAQALAARQDSVRGSVDTTALIVKHFRGRNLAPEMLIAITLRLEALSLLISDGELRHWQLGETAGDGGVTIDGTTFEAAAQAPLLFDDATGSKPRFEPQSFRDLVLSLAATLEGDADGSH